MKNVDFGDLFVNDAFFLYYTLGFHNGLAFPSWFYRMKRCVIISLLLKGGKWEEHFSLKSEFVAILQESLGL